MNNYEINCVIRNYLELWCKNKLINYVPLTCLLMFFDKKYYKFIEVFFENNEIYYDDYITFVFVIMFCKKNSILSLVLFFANVKSNVIITNEQIDKFMNLFKRDFNKSSIPELDIHEISIPDSSSPVFSYKAFTSFIYNCEVLTSFIRGLKKNITDFVLGKETYTIIINRKKFINQNNNVQPPKEPCCKELYRRLFTVLPDPYHYDYSMPKSAKYTADNIIFDIKISKGYADRRISQNDKKFIFSSSGLVPNKSADENKFKANSYNDIHKSILSPYSMPSLSPFEVSRSLSVTERKKSQPVRKASRQVYPENY